MRHGQIIGLPARGSFIRGSVMKTLNHMTDPKTPEHYIIQELLAALNLMLTREMPLDGTLEWKIENGRRAIVRRALAKAEGRAE